MVFTGITSEAEERWWSSGMTGDSTMGSPKLVMR